MLAYWFVALAVAVRLMPHPLAFTPVTGALLYFGARGPRRQAWVPVVLLMGSDLAGSVSFFLFSNFSSWLTWTDMYPRTLAGLMACYAAGVPFFRRALQGDLLFTGAMFALPVVAHSLAEVFEKAGDRAAAA